MNLLTLPVMASWFLWFGFNFLTDELTYASSLSWGIKGTFSGHLLFLLPASSGRT